MFYVFSGYGDIEEEFESFEEADAYIDAHGTEDMWVASDEEEEIEPIDLECGFDPYSGEYSWDC